MSTWFPVKRPTVTEQDDNSRPPEVSSELAVDGTLTLGVSGRLDAHTTARAWEEAAHIVRNRQFRELVIDASGITYCDGAGATLLLYLRRQAARKGAEAQLSGLPEQYQALLERFSPDEFELPAGDREQEGVIGEIGRRTVEVGRDLYSIMEFAGRLLVALLRTAVRPHTCRWNEVLFMLERVGANAFPMLALLSFLVGWVITLKAVGSLQQFGASAMAGRITSASLFLEVAPLLTAVILVTRSCSAFAAELGTMKLTQETMALSTMGLDPMNFLVVPRVVASVVAMPLLTIFFAIFGLLGGALVSIVLRQSLATYYMHVIQAPSPSVLTGALFKCVVFGLLGGAIGCMRGLQARPTAQEVGQTATRAVVTGVVVIALTDALFAAIFHQLGI